MFFAGTLPMDSTVYQPPWRHGNGRGAASPTHTFLVNAFLRPFGVSRGQHHSLTQPTHPPFLLAHRTSWHQSGPGALAWAALWDLPGYSAWDVGSDLRVWAGPERGGGTLGRPRLWLQIMLYYVWTQGCESIAVPNVSPPKRSSVGCSWRQLWPLIHFIIPCLCLGFLGCAFVVRNVTVYSVTSGGISDGKRVRTRR